MCMWKLTNIYKNQTVIFKNISQQSLILRHRNKDIANICTEKPDISEELGNFTYTCKAKFDIKSHESYNFTNTCTFSLMSQQTSNFTKSIQQSLIIRHSKTSNFTNVYTTYLYTVSQQTSNVINIYNPKFDALS